MKELLLAIGALSAVAVTAHAFDQRDLDKLMKTRQCASCNLVGANLVGADLSRANLVGADLRGADLSHAYLMGANLQNSRQDGANFSGAVWTDGRVCREGSIGDCR
jgi:uncharacterized protein YjbI with pentapeptide repeats